MTCTDCRSIFEKSPVDATSGERAGVIAHALNCQACCDYLNAKIMEYSAEHSEDTVARVKAEADVVAIALGVRDWADQESRAVIKASMDKRNKKGKKP